MIVFFDIIMCLIVNIDTITFNRRPIVTGTSIVALKTKNFVIMAGDTLGLFVVICLML